MRVLVAIEPVDGRKGIDSLARLCQDKLAEDPFSGCVFVFRSRSGTAIVYSPTRARILVVAEAAIERPLPDGGRKVGPSRPLEAYEAQLLLAAGDVSRVRAAPMWRRSPP